MKKLPFLVREKRSIFILRQGKTTLFQHLSGKKGVFFTKSQGSLFWRTAGNHGAMIEVKFFAFSILQIVEIICSLMSSCYTSGFSNLLQRRFPNLLSLLSMILPDGDHALVENSRESCSQQIWSKIQDCVSFCSHNRIF